jgi:hypothetical protein
MQGIATTPFLAGLARTLPQLTPGLTPEALAVAFGGVHSSPDSEASPPSAPAATGSDSAAHPPQSAAGHAAENAQEAAQRVTKLADQQAGMAVPSAALMVQSAGPADTVDLLGAFAELEDLTPGPRHRSRLLDMTVWEAALGSAPGSEAAAGLAPAAASVQSAALGPAGNAPSRGAVAAEPTDVHAGGAQHAPAGTHKKHVSWGSTAEAEESPAAAEVASCAAEPSDGAGPVQDAESVGSASPSAERDQTVSQDAILAPLSSQGSNTVLVISCSYFSQFPCIATFCQRCCQ